MLREATDSPATVNVLDVSSESMAAFQVILYGRFWVFTEEGAFCRRHTTPLHAVAGVIHFGKNCRPPLEEFGSETGRAGWRSLASLEDLAARERVRGMR